MDGGGVDSLSHSLLSPPTTSNFISPASHPHLSAECSTQSSRGGSAHPDLWLSVLNQFDSIRASLAIWIGESSSTSPVQVGNDLEYWQLLI